MSAGTIRIALDTAALASRQLTADELTSAQRATVEVGIHPGETFTQNAQGQIVGGTIRRAHTMHRPYPRREFYYLGPDDLIPEYGESVQSPEYIARNEAHKRNAGSDQR